MRGVILAGGHGSRLYPLTAVTNKHLTPIGNLPMIEYPLHTFGSLNLVSISIVTGGEHFKDIAGYLVGVHPEHNFSFHYQKTAGGIAQALQVPGAFLKGNKLAVILGDNIFEDDFAEAAKSFENSDYGAMLFLKRVIDPERFGVAEVSGDNIVSIEEKPKSPKSDLAVTGLYFFDDTVFEKIAKLRPSSRGELEVTDLNNLYLAEGRLTYALVDGFWSDSGTCSSRRVCEDFVRKGLEKRVMGSLSSDIRKKILDNLETK